VGPAPKFRTRERDAPESAKGGKQPGQCELHKSTTPNRSAGKKSVKPELSFREICRTMGRNLRIIKPPEPEQEQLELFEAAQGEPR